MASESIAKKSLRVLSQKSEQSIALFKQAVSEEKTSDEKLNRTLKQYVSRWNDITRPGMLALSFEAAGGEQGKSVPLQFALLYIDATMDIHDDVIDESIAKKKVKTIYGKMGKETTLLIGDKFMVKGFTHLHKALENLPVERQESIMDSVEDFLSEVVDAHVSEAALKADRWHVKPEQYLQVLFKKAADIEGRMKMGAIYGGGSPQEVETLSKLGRNIGILLVIREEFIDMFESDELTNRVKNECLPLPILYAIQNKTCKRKIRKILSKDKISNEDCIAVLDIIDNSTEVSTLKKYLLQIEKESIELLGVLNEKQARNDLHSLTVSLLESL